MDLFFFVKNHLNELSPCNRSEQRLNELKKTEWGTRRRLGDHAASLDCLNCCCVAFAVQMHRGRKRFFSFFCFVSFKVLDISVVSGYAAHGAVNDLTLITRRASHQPSGSVSCSCLSSV